MSARELLRKAKARITRPFDDWSVQRQVRVHLVKLGHSPELVECMLDDAQCALQGTRFTMRDIAPAVGRAAAVGIRPGKDLEFFLRLAADAASVSGETIGTLASLMARVEGRGCAYSSDIAVLDEAGISIWEGLHLVTGRQPILIAMDAYDGRITADTFRLALADTVSGAARNPLLPRCGGVFP